MVYIPSYFAAVCDIINIANSSKLSVDLYIPVDKTCFNILSAIIPATLCCELIALSRCLYKILSHQKD